MWSVSQYRCGTSPNKSSIEASRVWLSRQVVYLCVFVCGAACLCPPVWAYPLPCAGRQVSPPWHRVSWARPADYRLLFDRLDPSLWPPLASRHLAKGPLWRPN